MATRTDHSASIANLRESVAIWETAYNDTGSEMMHEMALAGRAAADLLELHDTTSLNLHTAPGLLAFVEHIFGESVEPNYA